MRIVLNGIIENYADLREQLQRSHGIECVSETDAEIVAQLIGLYYDGDLAEAVHRSLPELNSHYAFVAMSDHEAGTLVGVRKECPFILGQGAGENFIASSIAAFRAHTNQVTVLDDDEIVVLHPDNATIIDPDGYYEVPLPEDVGPPMLLEELKR